MTSDAWWLDEAQEQLADDAFDRGPFVARVVQALDRVAAHDASTVIGLVGPWGSGKTSIVNFVLTSLDQAKWKPVLFNPWAINSQEALIAEFCAVLAKAVDDGTDEGYARRKKVEESANILIPSLRAIPVVGKALEGVAEKVQDRLTRTLAEELAVLAKLPGSDGPIPLVVVDDLDRLQPHELLLVLQMVRLVGRVSRVHYLLAYDEQTILDLIAGTQLANNKPDRALAYLEKIVQLKLDIPPIDRLQAERKLADGLDAVLKENDVLLGSAEIERFHLLYALLLSRTLTEPRKIRRYIAQVSMYLPLVDADEVDVIDFLALTLLRTEYPSLYRVLVHEGPELCVTRVAQDTAPIRARWLKLVDGRRHSQQLWALLAHLFPILDDAKDADELGVWIDHQERLSSKRVCNPEYFQRFFTFGIPMDDLSDVEVRRALDERLSGLASERVERLEVSLMGTDSVVSEDDVALRNQSADRRVRTIRKLARLVDSVAPDQLPALLGFALSATHRPDRPSLLGSPHEAIMDWIVSILGQVQSRDKGSLSFENLIELPSDVETLCRACIRAVAGEQPSGALQDVFCEAADLGTRVIVEDLRAGREGDFTLDVPLLVRFALSWGRPEELRDSLLALLESDVLTVDQILARFVSHTPDVPVVDAGLLGFAKDPLIALFPLEQLADLVDSHPASPITSAAEGWELLERVGREQVAALALERQIRPPQLPESISVMPKSSKAWNQLSPRELKFDGAGASSLTVRASMVRSLGPEPVTRADAGTRERELGEYLVASPFRRFVAWNSPTDNADEARKWVPVGVNNDGRTELSWEPVGQSPLVGRTVVDFEWEERIGIVRAGKKEKRTGICLTLEIGLAYTMPTEDGKSFLPLTLPEVNDLVVAVAQTCVGAMSIVAHDSMATELHDELFLYLHSPAGELADVVDLGGIEIVPGGGDVGTVGASAAFPMPQSRPSDLSNDDANLLASGVLRALLDARQARDYAALLHRIINK